MLSDSVVKSKRTGFSVHTRGDLQDECLGENTRREGAQTQTAGNGPERAVTTLARASCAFDAQHRELASDITECKICAGHFCSLSTTRQGRKPRRLEFLLIGTFYPSRGRLGMRRATLAACAALITLGATGSLADRSLALPLSDPRVHDLAIAGSPIQKAWCRRWWQWHGARWVRSCWPAGYDPCGYARGCAPPTWHHPYWRPWGGPPPYRYWLY